MWAYTKVYSLGLLVNAATHVEIILKIIFLFTMVCISILFFIKKITRSLHNLSLLTIILNDMTAK